MVCVVRGCGVCVVWALSRWEEWATCIEFCPPEYGGQVEACTGYVRIILLYLGYESHDLLESVDGDVLAVDSDLTHQCTIGNLEGAPKRGQ